MFSKECGKLEKGGLPKGDCQTSQNLDILNGGLEIKLRCVKIGF